MSNKIKTVANRVLFLLTANILLLAVACCFALHKLPPWAVSLALIECASGLMEESADELTLIDLNGDGTPEILAKRAGMITGGYLRNAKGLWNAFKIEGDEISVCFDTVFRKNISLVYSVFDGDAGHTGIWKGVIISDDGATTENFLWERICQNAEENAYAFKYTPMDKKTYFSVKNKIFDRYEKTDVPTETLKITADTTRKDKLKWIVKYLTDTL